MALPATALVSITEAQEYCRATTADLPALERYVVAACDWLGKETGRQLYSAAITNSLFSGDGMLWLVLHEWPVTAVASASYWNGTGWTAFDLTYLVIHPLATKVYLRDQVWPKGTLNIKATYTAGYATIPEDLKQATLELTLDKWRMADRQTQGVTTINYEGQTVTVTPEAVPRSVRQVADRYKRVAM